MTPVEINLLRIARDNPRVVVPLLVTATLTATSTGPSVQKPTEESKAADRLCFRGLLSFRGGDDSKHEFSITDAGRESLAAIDN